MEYNWKGNGEQSEEESLNTKCLYMKKKTSAGLTMIRSK